MTTALVRRLFNGRLAGITVTRCTLLFWDLRKVDVHCASRRVGARKGAEFGVRRLVHTRAVSFSPAASTRAQLPIRWFTVRIFPQPSRKIAVMALLF
jgi:hypothetical protein